MILCIGPSPTVQRTMTFDRLAVDAVNRTARVHEYASGKSVNAARVLTSLGTPAVAMGFAGGRRGEFMRSDCDAAGVAHDFVAVAPVTRLSTTAIDLAERTATELVEEPAALTAADGDALLARLADRLAGGGVTGVIVSGALPVGLGDDYYARACRLAVAAGVTTVLDARGAALRLACGERPTVAKPNRAELAATLGVEIGSRSSLLEAMRLLADGGSGGAAGPAWVVVTQGAGPTLAAGPGGAVWEVHGPRVQVLSPIGSGDAFAAGLAVGLASGDAPDALRLAAACGSANALTEHAGHVDAAEVERLARDVRVARL